MGRLFFLGSLSIVSVVSLARPWIGVVTAYLFVILTPQAVWYWNFDGIRPVLMVLLPTLLGFGLGVLRGIFNFDLLKNRRMLFLLILWFTYIVSYYLGPFVGTQGPWRFTDPNWAMTTLHKTFLLFFVASLCIDNEKKLLVLTGVLVLSTIYLTYWANDMYLSGHVLGRLAGPVDVTGTSIYSDENNFAMLFVVGTPFLWFAGYYFKSTLIRWGLWLVIPLAWHAIFLTASRGGLVGLGFTVLLTAYRSKNKAFGLLLIPALIGAYVWQAGDLMRDRAETIDDFKVERSAATRLEAWETALKMVKDNPMTGVGLASFAPAFSSYSTYRPREAHNTVLQIAGESGFIAGLMYVLIVYATLMALWKNGLRLRPLATDPHYKNRYLLNEATLVSFAGLVCCSLFLSLQMFEIFFCLCVIANAVLYLSNTASDVRKVSTRRGARDTPVARQKEPVT